jgi:hypothetical protein
MINYTTNDRCTMFKFIIIFFSSILIALSIPGCKGKKPSPMVDMDTIRNDGSHNDKYIFRKEIEKEEKRGNKYKKNKF